VPSTDVHYLFIFWNDWIDTATESWGPLRYNFILSSCTRTIDLNHTVYYRLYTKDGPLESINPIYSNDRFIGRILSTSVRPPHTATSLKRHLCKIEGLASENCTLYQSLSENTALEDSTRLSLRGTPGPGLSVDDPIALVSGHVRQSQAESSAASQELLERDFEQRYGTVHSLHLT
jgi:hypothetical protein